MPKLRRQTKPAHGAAAKAKKAAAPKAQPKRAPSAKDRPRSYYEAVGEAEERRAWVAARGAPDEDDAVDDGTSGGPSARRWNAPARAGEGAAPVGSGAAPTAGVVAQRRMRPRAAEAPDGDGADASGGVDEGDADGAVDGGAAAPAGFAAAMAKILSRDVPVARNPVLAKRHTAAAKLAAADKAAVKADKERKREKRDARRAHIVEPADADPELERTLRKVATRGVVALFNAISKHQRAVAAAAAGASADVAPSAASTDGSRPAAPSATAAAPSAGGGAGHGGQKAVTTFLELLAQSTRGAGAVAAAGASAGAQVRPVAAVRTSGGAKPAGAPAWSVLQDGYAQQGGEGEADSDDGSGDGGGLPGGAGVLDSDSDDA